jgi:RNA polymerase sigma-70 factor (ECF subfamily)
MPEGTVKSYLFRGRKLLKEKLSVYLKNELS